MNIKISYWINKRLEFDVYRENNKIRIMITPLFKEKELTGYENEWFYKKWWFIDIPFKRIK